VLKEDQECEAEGGAGKELQEHRVDEILIVKLTLRNEVLLWVMMHDPYRLSSLRFPGYGSACLPIHMLLCTTCSFPYFSPSSTQNQQSSNGVGSRDTLPGF
jgi:hypothetical protein